MSALPLISEVVVTFLVATVVLYRYANWYRHSVLVTGAVLVAWYFSMLIVLILPLDISNTIYENCIQSLRENLATNISTNISVQTTVATNISGPSEGAPVLPPSPGLPQSPPELPQSELPPSELPQSGCLRPGSFVAPEVFAIFWRIVYWTSQILTWLILPLMQSYTKAGDFTFVAKLKSAAIDNAIYYGSYLLIVGILLLYIALTDLGLDGGKLRAIAASASNSWGLFWLVLLLGYGLVEVPRTLWHSSSTLHTLHQAYFQAAKLSQERAESTERVNDLLLSTVALSGSIGPGHPLRAHMDTIENKIPAEMLGGVRGGSTGTPSAQDNPPHPDVPSEKALVRLHKQLLKALQCQRRVITQWDSLIEKIIYLEDTHKNATHFDRTFKPSSTNPQKRGTILRLLYTPTIEWYWRCRVRGGLLKCLAAIAGVTSIAVVWSELVFFITSPPLSIFAIVINLAKANYCYLTIEIISSLSMAYIALCAYSTLFKIRVLNLYYLASNHQTDEYSLIFSGLMLSRLTPPMCLNFLSLIHMDSHVIRERTEETHYTQIMGHMDVIRIISDGFNIYFPMTILMLCLATYYSLGSRILSALGFQQFMIDDGMTTDLIEEGRTLVARETRRRQRLEDSAVRRKDFVQRFGAGESSASLYRSARQRAERLIRPLKRESSSESAHIELLCGTDRQTDGHPPSYTSPQAPPSPERLGGREGGGGFFSPHVNPPRHPDKGLFDDI